jgi:hypothetical protein
MTSKITLYSESELIKEIKLYAKNHNTSVSKIVNTFFKNILHSEKPSQKKSKITDSLIGIIKTKSLDESDYKDYLVDKYL